MSRNWTSENLTDLAAVAAVDAPISRRDLGATFMESITAGSTLIAVPASTWLALN
jgi:hypothetical protein